MMLRSLFTSVLVVVVAGVLVLGGCLSCQNLFSRKQISKGCCETNGKCKTPARQGSEHQHCKSPAIGLEQYVAAHPDRVFQGWGAPEAVVAEAVLAAAAAPAVVESGYSPPAIFLLTSTFRI